MLPVTGALRKRFDSDEVGAPLLAPDVWAKKHAYTIKIIKIVMRPRTSTSRGLGTSELDTRVLVKILLR